ncbi:MAG: serine/threonine protein phosphatase [FCB group bacterium]|nr:serine/threonine protein phosphatase [FCB group bacterium]
MRILAVGDIHGGFKALLQALERARFTPQSERLISLGDVCDGWSQTRETIEYLRTLPNVILIRGNHDLWTQNWMETGLAHAEHRRQGGQATLDSYRGGIPENHRQFLQAAQPYHVDENNQLFVHAGFEPDVSLEKQDVDRFYWDRSLYMAAAHQKEKFHIPEFTRVFIGHTPTLKVQPDATPVIWGNLINLDQGAGWEGRLTVMDVNSLEYWQSDRVMDLYPGEPGRLDS